MNILSIGGSDPSSGAGIQNDLKVFSTLGAYCFTVITSITSQNSKKFYHSEPVSVRTIDSQIDSIFSDFDIDAIKIGMVLNSAIIKKIHNNISKLKIPIIVDPVIESTTGGILLEKKSISEYKKLIVSLAYVITPNVIEAEKLTGKKIKTKIQLKMAAMRIQKMGAKNIIITGNEFDKKTISDFILYKSKSYTLTSKKLKIENHGSGCTYSSALTYQIAKGKNILEASKFAKKFTFESIKNSNNIGKGISFTQEKLDVNKKILARAVTEFLKNKKSHTIIPECQTNFVFSKSNPKSINEILGIVGRIVKADKNCIVAGSFEYGGSKHVASAVLEISKRFPKIKSAINIKYNKKTIMKCKRKKMIVSNYDRKKEPIKMKSKENSSIQWGIKNAIQKLKVPPDVIFHKGDFGKEPMILVFGKNPDDVMDKITKIL